MGRLRQIKFRFQDIEDAYDFVSSAPYGEHTAVLCKSTGRILCKSEVGDLDETSNVDLEADDCVGIPHKVDLEMGEHLALDFVSENLPDDLPRISEMFGRQGAYRRFREFLESKELLQFWYDFESKHQKRVLREWCENNGIELSD